MDVVRLTRSVPDGLLTLYDAAVLEHVGDAQFELLGAAPEWFAGYFATEDEGRVGLALSSAFLTMFLEDAAQHWANGEGRLLSGPWTEAGADGQAFTLEASAIKADDRELLLIAPPSLNLDAVQQLLQGARDEHLARERERKDVEQREVLLHCIVHDLSNPLSGLKGSLQLLAEDDLVQPDGAELLAIAMRQVERMQTEIRAVLDAFQAEVAKQLPSAGEDAPPDASADSHTVAAALAPAAQLAGLELVVDAPNEPLLIVGDKGKFQRVLFNLVGNALRYAPAGTEVRIAVQEKDGQVEIAVEDEGPGVPPKRVETLFKRFGKGPEGQTGLGLYFCRITAEHWGGRVGYATREGGGARFWVRLPRRG